MKTAAHSRRPVRAFCGVVVVAFALYFTMCAVQRLLPPLLFDYDFWYEKLPRSALYRILWMIGDAAEPPFHKSLFGGLGLLVGSVTAFFLDRRQSGWGGTPICYGTGRWPWVFCASLLSLSIATLLFGGVRIPGDPWVGTFAPYVSVAGAVVLIYGCSFPVLVIGAVLGALTVTPITLFCREYIAFAFGLPGGMASVTGMCLGGVITFEVCRYLPFLKKDGYVPPINRRVTPASWKKERPDRFFILRMFADFSEPVFAGTEWAGALLIVGSLFSWGLNPSHIAYGTGYFPAILLSQVLGNAVALFLYWDGWMENDFCATFVPIVSVSPAMVLTYGASMFVILVGAVLGGVLCTPMAHFVNRHIPAHWHAMVGFTFSMALCECTVGIILRYLLAAFPFL